MSRRLTSLAAAIFSLSLGLFAVQPNCDVNCGPNSGSPDYSGLVSARGTQPQARGTSSPTAPTSSSVPVYSGTPASTTVVRDFGSESYNYAMPLIHFPGRAGMDLDLTLYYNSRVWTVSGSNIALNADLDWPNYGFRLGWGFIQDDTTNGDYILTMKDGSKEVLTWKGQGDFGTTDGTLIDFYPGTGGNILRYPDGTWVQYIAFPSNAQNYQNLFRVQGVINPNGNMIYITYRTDSWATGQEINTVSDAAGHVFYFNYAVVPGTSTYALSTITQGSTTGKVWATFNWGTKNLRYLFSGLTVNSGDAPANNSTINTLNSVVLPDNTKYSFIWTNQANDTTDADWAIVSAIVYQSSSGAIRRSVSCNFPLGTNAQSSAPTYTQETVFDGVNSNTWTFADTQSSGVVTKSTITDPSGAISVSNLDSGTGLVTSVQLQNSGGTTLRNIAYTYNANNQVLTATTTLSDTGQQSKITYAYNSSQLLTDIYEYDWGLTLQRHTIIGYATTTPWTNQHILNLPWQKQVLDGAGNVVALTQMGYDESALTGVTGAAGHYDALYPATFTTRGNLTRLTRYSNAAAQTGIIQRTFTYDSTGNMLTAQLDCCNQKQWNFSSTTQWVFPDSIVTGPSGTQLTTSATYDTTNGLVLTRTDENGKVTSFTYNDPDNRLTQVQRPDSAQINYSYDDSSALGSTTVSTTADSLVHKTTFNGNGQRVEFDSLNGTTTISTTQWTYDNLGRQASVTNPYAPGDTVHSTSYSYDNLNRLTTVTPPSGGNYSYAYSGNSVLTTDPAGKQRKNFSDALGRLVQVVEPGWGDATPGTGSIAISGTEQSVCLLQSCTSNTLLYDTGWVKITVNGASKQVNYGKGSTSSSVASALVTAINGDGTFPATAALSGSTINLTTRTIGSSANSIGYSSSSATTGNPDYFTDPSFGGSPASANFANAHDACPSGGPSFSCPITTTYTYNALDLLTNASVAAMGPVNGVMYTGQPRAYQYDSIGRATNVTTPESGAVTTSYLTSGGATCSTNPSLPCYRTDARSITATMTYDGLNRLTGVTYSDGTTAETYNYGTSSTSNNNGRLTVVANGLNQQTYTYDTLGRVTNVANYIDSNTYNVGYGYNSADEVTSITYPSGRVVTQGFDAIGRLSSIASPGTTYLSGLSYNAAGQPLAFTYGNGVQGAFTYNDHLQIGTIRYYMSGQPNDVLNLTYDYGTNNNGQIQTIHYYTVPGTEDLTKGEAFTYDSWWRLSTAHTLDNTTWGLSWTYDRLGNRTAQTVTAGTGPSSSLTIDQSTNRISQTGYIYDAAGNMTNDSFHSYAFDAINRLKTVDSTGAAYTYLGALRIKKIIGATSTVYVYNGSRPLAEYTNGTLSREYVYGRSKMLVSIAGSTTTYDHSDGLGIRAQTNTSGQVVRIYGSFPYGETWYETGTPDKWKFTSYERDTESALDYALARFDTSAQGRFLSPDPVGGSTSQPQSLNRYSYSLNDPTNTSDPSGLTACPFQESGAGGDHCGFGRLSLGSGMNAGGVADWLGPWEDPTSFDPLGDAEKEFDSSFGIKYCDSHGSCKTFQNWDEYADWLTSQAAAADDKRKTQEQFNRDVEKVFEAKYGHPPDYSNSDDLAKLDDISYFLATHATGVYGGNLTFDVTGTEYASLCNGNAELRCSDGVHIHTNGTTASMHVDQINPFANPWFTLFGIPINMINLGGHFAVDVLWGNLSGSSPI